MKKITIEFQDENSTEFTVDGDKLTHRELLVLARLLPKSGGVHLPGDKPIIEIEPMQIDGDFIVSICAAESVGDWQLQLVADEFYLIATQVLLAPLVQGAAQGAVQVFFRALQEQQAVASLQNGAQGGLIRGVGG